MCRTDGAGQLWGTIPRMHLLEWLTLSGGIVAGFLGALMGIGGGILLVPLLNGLLGLSMAEATAVSLVGVLATSSSAAFTPQEFRLVNVRLATFLLVFSVAGATAGAAAYTLFSERAYQIIFGVTAAVIGGLLFAKRNRRNILQPGEHQTGTFGSLVYDSDTDSDVVYRVRRLPVAAVVAFIAGVLASFIGIGGGIVIVPVLNSLCGVPLRVAAATSVLMIGVTAVSGAAARWAGGHLGDFHLAGAACIGVLIGFQIGLRVGPRTEVKWLKLAMAALLALVSVQYLFLQ
jgi:uncharacterized membrane protein YfcA